MPLEQINEKIQSIQEELRNIKETVLTESKRKKKLESIKKSAEKTKEELERKISTLKDKAKEEAQVLLNSLNEIINFRLSIWDNEKSASWNWEKWFFSKAKNWISEQWDKAMKDENLKDNLRTAWVAAAGIWVTVLAYKWVKKLWNRAFCWNDEGKNKENEKEQKTEDLEVQEEKKEKEEKERKTFWKSWFWRTLKWLWIWWAVAWWAFWIWKFFNKWKMDSDNSNNEQIETQKENKIKKLSWFENECKKLKEWADRCLNLTKTSIVDYGKNKEEYDWILSKAMNIKNESTTIFNEINMSNASVEEKQRAENIKNNIESYVKSIEDMKHEIYKNVPEQQNNWNNNHLKTNNKENLSASSEYFPINSSVITQATINFLENDTKWLTLKDEIKNKIKNNMNKYLASYPLLKKDKNNNMKFEVLNKNEFSKMIKQTWDDILAWMPWLKRNALKWALNIATKSGLDNIDETVRNLSAKNYELVVFRNIWWVVQKVVRQEWWKLKLSDYYTSISKTYPNKNASVVERHLASSWQTNSDISNMRYPMT